MVSAGGERGHFHGSAAAVPAAGRRRGSASTLTQSLASSGRGGGVSSPTSSSGTPDAEKQSIQAAAKPQVSFSSLSPTAAETIVNSGIGVHTCTCKSCESVTEECSRTPLGTHKVQVQTHTKEPFVHTRTCCCSVLLSLFVSPNNPCTGGSSVWFWEFCHALMGRVVSPLLLWQHEEVGVAPRRHYLPKLFPLSLQALRLPRSHHQQQQCRHLQVQPAIWLSHHQLNASLLA